MLCSTLSLHFGATSIAKDSYSVLLTIPFLAFYLLSETPAVDLGDGVGGHGTPDAGAGGRTLGHRGDAVWRVLTGWGKGRVAGHAQTGFCGAQQSTNNN